MFFAAKIHFIIGKGGVGKSVIAQGLAKALAQKHNTLLISLYEEPIEDKNINISFIEEISPNLSYIKLYPDRVLYEYLLLKLKSEKIVHMIWSKGLFQNLYTIMPGLSDLIRLGKIWYHADHKHDLVSKIFDKIVVDMPSNGFVDRFLSIASLVYDAVKIGPIAQDAQMMSAYFADKNNAIIHLVSLLEDMVVSETIDFYHQLNKAHINWGVLLINRCFDMSIKDVVLNNKKTPYLYNIYQNACLRQQQEELNKADLLSRVDLFHVDIADIITENEAILIDNIAANMAEHL